MRRYYPGFFAALLIILLRIAIGWHFLTEGSEKLRSTEHNKTPFSAEGYLRNASGPFGHYFRDALPDADGRATLDLSKLKASWRAEANRIAAHFHFTDEQKNVASKLVDEAERWADGWFADPENTEKRNKYFHQFDELEKAEANPALMSFELERVWDARRDLDTDRRALVGPIHERGKELSDAIARKATREQVAAAGSPWISRIRRTPLHNPTATVDEQAIESADASRPWTQLDWINFTTTFGLIAIGVCLILGFLTPLAALGGAAFLAMIYLSLPPWPGVPPNPRTEGNYFIVSKNLIELIACLVIATTPTGHWIGLDALFFGARRRRRLARLEGQRAPERAPVSDRPATATATATPRTDTPRDPIPLS
ncbi:MAG: hypothetical protein ACYC61_30860, partial [Isosphaeraceae bacterium]